MTNNRTSGFWILMIFGVLILLMLIMGQTMSFINYEFAVSIGLQESEKAVGKMGVTVNKAFGVGDTMIYLPIMLAGLIGLWLKKTWGLFTMAAAMGITAYWPMVCLFVLIFSEGTPGFNFDDFTTYTIVLTSITIYGLWGLWYLYKNQKLLIEEE